MKRRLYFVLPDLASAIQSANDLLLARIDDREMHFLGRRGMSLGNLHEASYFQKSDIVRGAEMGFVIGGALGTLVGIWLYLSQPAGFEFQMVVILVAAVIGSLFCAWAGSLVAVSTPNSRLLRFSKEIDDGNILLMVDVPSGRIEEVRALVAQRQPESAGRGMEPTIPAFP
jgi:hypothetical protein